MQNEGMGIGFKTVHVNAKKITFSYKDVIFFAGVNPPD